MTTAYHRFPTRATASTGARLGCHRHFTVVVPFLRSSYALRPVVTATNGSPAAAALRALSASQGRREDLPHVA